MRDRDADLDGVRVAVCVPDADRDAARGVLREGDCDTLGERVGSWDTDSEGDADADTDTDGLPDSEGVEGWLGELDSEDELAGLHDLNIDALPACEKDGDPDCDAVRVRDGDGGPLGVADELGELDSLPVKNCKPLTVLVIEPLAVCTCDAVFDELGDISCVEVSVTVELAEPETVCEGEPLTVLVIEPLAVCTCDAVFDELGDIGCVDVSVVLNDGPCESVCEALLVGRWDTEELRLGLPVAETDGDGVGVRDAVESWDGVIVGVSPVLTVEEGVSVALTVEEGVIVALDEGEGAWLGLTLDDCDAGCERVRVAVKVLLRLAVVVNEADAEDEEDPAEDGVGDGVGLRVDAALEVGASLLDPDSLDVVDLVMLQVAVGKLERVTVDDRDGAELRVALPVEDCEGGGVVDDVGHELGDTVPV